MNILITRETIYQNVDVAVAVVAFVTCSKMSCEANQHMSTIMLFHSNDGDKSRDGV